MEFLKKLFGMSKGSAKLDPIVKEKWPSKWEWHSISANDANSPTIFRTLARGIVHIADRQPFPVIVSLTELIESGERDGRTVAWSGGVRFACPCVGSVPQFLASINLSDEAKEFKKCVVGIGIRDLVRSTGREGEDFDRIIRLFSNEEAWRCNWK